MDLEDQLKKLFPEHVPEEVIPEPKDDLGIWMQDDPLICKYIKQNGKPMTLIEGYNGAKSDFKTLTRLLQRQLGVGGSFKADKIIIQGNNRDKIMEQLKSIGFNVKRVGG